MCGLLAYELIPELTRKTREGRLTRMKKRERLLERVCRLSQERREMRRLKRRFEKRTGSATFRRRWRSGLRRRRRRRLRRRPRWLASRARRRRPKRRRVHRPCPEQQPPARCATRREQGGLGGPLPKEKFLSRGRRPRLTQEARASPRRVRHGLARRTPTDHGGRTETWTGVSCAVSSVKIWGRARARASSKTARFFRNELGESLWRLFLSRSRERELQAHVCVSAAEFVGLLVSCRRPTYIISI